MQITICRCALDRFKGFGVVLPFSLWNPCKQTNKANQEVVFENLD